jgi:hypothetical protein
MTCPFITYMTGVALIDINIDCSHFVADITLLIGTGGCELICEMIGMASGTYYITDSTMTVSSMAIAAVNGRTPGWRNISIGRPCTAFRLYV